MSNDSVTADATYLRISLGEEEYAIPLLRVREVIAVPEVTPIPQTPNYFLGVINLRGQVISVVDMRTKLNIKPVNGPEMAVVICDLGGVSLGVVVDSINSVITPRAEELSERPELKGQKAMEYITAVYRHEKGMVLLIDITKLFNFDDQSAATKAAQSTKAA